MTLLGATHRSRLKHHGRRIVVRERHQRPRVQDLGTEWRICYWDYGSGKRSGRTKGWAKSSVSSKTEAQRLADQFMATANERNNQPQLFPSGKESLAGLVAVCREKMWPLLKNSTRISYDFNLDTYILPTWGSMQLTKLRTIELQDFFNSFSPRLAPKTIRNMHGCLRAILNQGKPWGLVRVNPAQGVRLPRKKARKPPVVLGKQDIRRVIDALPEPTRSIITLIIVGSLRIGEIAALRWERIHSDRIDVVERFYEGRVRRHQDRCRTPEHPARFLRNPAECSGIALAAVEASESGRFSIHQCARRAGKPAQSAAEATQANPQEAWLTCHRGLSEFPHYALKPHEQRRRSA